MQGCPPVDLLIRTSGENRLSDFLLYQSSCAQLHFSPVLWPEFSFREFFFAIVSFQASYPYLTQMQLQRSREAPEQSLDARQNTQHEADASYMSSNVSVTNKKADEELSLKDGHQMPALSRKQQERSWPASGNAWPEQQPQVSLI